MSLAVATFNLCNLGPDVPTGRLARIARVITADLGAPAILAVQEVSTPGEGTDPVPAAPVYEALTGAVAAAGGPRYGHCEVAPRPGHDGGRAGMNIRTGVLYDPARARPVLRGAASPEDAARLRWDAAAPALEPSPGRLHPTDPAFVGDPHRHWAPSRKALAVEFRIGATALFLVACHLKSMRGPSRRVRACAKKQRHAQASLIHQFVDALLSRRPHAAVVVLGDMNDLPGSKTLALLKGRHLHNVIEDLPRRLAYTRLHGTTPQALDHVLVSAALAPARACIPHVSADSDDPERASDHDPVLATLGLPCPPVL